VRQVLTISSDSGMGPVAGIVIRSARSHAVGPNALFSKTVNVPNAVNREDPSNR